MLEYGYCFVNHTVITCEGGYPVSIVKYWKVGAPS